MMTFIINGFGAISGRTRKETGREDGRIRNDGSELGMRRVVNGRNQDNGYEAGFNSSQWFMHNGSDLIVFPVVAPKAHGGYTSSPANWIYCRFHARRGAPGTRAS